ncbi:hypothetical protein [Halodesulfovibrio spirochaetisodalis]|uniref:Uncharacterized protein n=1 Tax=Halodesulfovibrio spirochaetisodalis TaxID=1560234 RepID=A0A1B7XL32_9BACT|nr:hypothetical protein [Halodesulfovibrio spirochaetisodalis]OBQ56228.1 hypothetical protein SP90_02620 [Halodesulfovibrio spirochaetisodalis]
MPNMGASGAAVMILIWCAEVTVYSIWKVLPCWIIAKRRNIAARWWNWVIPVWNFYTAYKLGHGSNRLLLLIIVLFTAGTAMLIANENSPAFLWGGRSLIIVGTGISLFVLYRWLMNIGILAGVHRHLLPLVLLVLQVMIAATLVAFTLTQEAFSKYNGVIDNALYLLSWIFFMIVAIRTPRVELRDTEKTFTEE